MPVLGERQALSLSVLAALLTIGLKFGAWHATGSVGLLSDALESLVNLAGAVFALLMVIYAQQPADRGHPFGHGKAEYFSSGFEGLLIVIAALGIFISAVDRLLAPQPLQAVGLGLGLTLLATLVNFAVARVLLHSGRVHAVANLDPYSGAHVISRGIVGTRDDVPIVASPMYKQVFDLRTGVCLDAQGKEPIALRTWPVSIVDGDVLVKVEGGA